MELSKDVNEIHVMSVLGTPVKPRQFLKFYVRRKSIKLLNKAQDIDCSVISPHIINNPGKPENCLFIQDNSQRVNRKEEKKNSKEEEHERKRENSEILQDDLQHNAEKEKRKNSKRTQKKQRFHRPRIMEEGKKPRNPATTRLRTISKKRKKNDKDSEDEVIVEPRTPEKQSFPKKRKNEKTKRKVARTLKIDQEIVFSCLDLSRIYGPNFPKGRKRTTTVRKTDFHSLISPIASPMPIWKKQSRRSNRKKNVVRWARIALSFELLEETMPLVVIHQKTNGLLSQTDGSLQIEDTVMRFEKRTKDIVEPLIQQMTHQENNDVSHGTEVPLQIKAPKRSNKRTNDIVELLIQQMTHQENNDVSHGTEVPLQIKAPKRSNKRTNDIVELLTQQMTHQENNDVSHGTEVPLQIKAPKRSNKRTNDIVEHLSQQMSYQKDHNLSSLADVPLHIEETLMKSASDVLPKRPIKKTNDISKLIKEMRRLKINKRVTTLIKSSKKLVTAKVNLDPDTIKEWELLMVNDLPNISSADNETEAKWKQEREIFQSRIDLFISRMHLLQGNRKFKQWKGSVVDSVVGVFLTQNVSDYLSSNAFMSVSAKFPADAREGLEGLAYYIEEPQDVNNSIDDDQRPAHIENDDAKSSESINLSKDSIPEVEEHEKTAKRKNEKTGIMEDEIVDWKALRRMYTKEGSRHRMHMDTVNWTDVRLSGQQVFATTIRKRGQFRILAGRILKFLSDEVKQNGTVDLEWLRDAPSDLVKRYLLEIEGIGLKSAECVRLLGLQHSAFPVDTNVGRIAVRLGWVPLEPLPNGVQMHQLFQYPSMDSIQKYLWPRLCKLPQETLYELHYQMITFGKVFCTKVIPNCNACPMKSECKYFASAYVSSKVLLEGPEEKTHESDSFMDAYSQDVDADITSNINLIEECGSPGCNEQDTCCKPMIEFPSSPRAIPELMDIEDAPHRNSCEQYAKIPEIDIDMDALKKNVEDALVEGGKMLNNFDDEISKALVVLTPENACIPIKPPRKIKYYDRLRTEHVVYVLPDNHELLRDFERRELDDPSPYLLAIWQPGETSYSFTPPKKKCNSDGSNLCKMKTCSYCWGVREQNSNIFRGTILIPCRTAMRGGFPLNGTYFQTNEVFADHETSLKPIEFPREWCEGLEKRALYCGSSVTSIFRFLDTRRIQLCFWTGFLCMRAFDRNQRNPQELVRRLHTPPVERGAKFMKDDDF